MNFPPKLRNHGNHWPGNFARFWKGPRMRNKMSYRLSGYDYYWWRYEGKTVLHVFGDLDLDLWPMFTKNDRLPGHSIINQPCKFQRDRCKIATCIEVNFRQTNKDQQGDKSVDNWQTDRHTDKVTQDRDDLTTSGYGEVSEEENKL